MFFNPCRTEAGVISDSPLEPFLDIGHNEGPWQLLLHSLQLLLGFASAQLLVHSEQAAIRNLKINKAV